jgi:hypothetical protein
VVSLIIEPIEPIEPTPAAWYFVTRLFSRMDRNPKAIDIAKLLGDYMCLCP